MPSPVIRIVESLADVAPGQWDRFADGPFLRHAFLHALSDTGCASGRTGWLPRHLTLWDGDTLRGAMPLYLKSHSYGEYVFDWAWADAYQRHGYDYYPKLLCAVPFTPVAGPRLLADDAATRRLLVDAAIALAQDAGASSLHVLYPTPEHAADLAAAGLMLRRGVQFHWHNRGYASFDDFLADMSHDKRKKVRQERARVRNAGITFRAMTGAEATPEDWTFFARCYRSTYRAHQSTPYLNLVFFQRLAAEMPDAAVLFVAERDGHPVAASFCMRDEATMYGRYWGALEYHHGLHFEACYYQTIEYCIAHGIGRFEGGAQGRHKIARGLLPVETCSAHWLAHPEFASAVERFLERESADMAHHIDELSERSPFREGTRSEGNG